MDLAGTINRGARRTPVWPVYAIGAVLPAWLMYGAASGGLGVDPVRGIEHQLGLWALQLIIAGLCITPLRRYAGVNLIKYRRAIGIVTFAYVLLHFLTWLVLDMGMLWGQALRDVVKRPYITIGMASLLLMIPLVATSNNLAVRRLGAGAWQKLHRLTYPAAILGAVHYVWLVKAWPVEPFLYLAAVMALLTLRALPRRRRTAV